MYGENWDQYYIRTYREGKSKALWDVPPEEAIARDFEQFRALLPADRPIIDLGCGTGTQSVFLAEHYPRVLAVDVAPEAIRVAKEHYSRSNLTFDILDATDLIKAQQLATEWGPSHIYMRGMLHQILEKDLPAFRTVLKTLLGNGSRLYCVEVSDRIREHFENTGGKFSELPKRLQQVFISNLPPRGLSLERLPYFFPKDEFGVIDAVDARLETNLKLSDGSAVYIPAVASCVYQLPGM
jgi:SAM-dependent methyltransferase